MKKNKIHIALSVFLLALMLLARVGIHVFHHHDTATDAASSGLLWSAEESEADCALCKLDAFQELAIESTIVFVFFLTVVKPVHRFLLTAFPSFSFFTKSRGPPFFMAVA